MYKRHYYWLGIAIFAGVFLSSKVIAATKEYTKSWNMMVIEGSLSSDKKLRYFLQPELNLIDDKYKIQNAFAFAGVGYQAMSVMTAWLMGGWSFVKKANGQVAHRSTIRQQVDWIAVATESVSLSCISRLEERKDASQPGWAVRVRERFNVRLPFKNWEHHSLVLFDELFFDLNHPAWVNSNTFLEQNRAFIGIGTQLSKHVSLDVGYLNQYVRKNKDAMSNVLSITLNVNLV